MTQKILIVDDELHMCQSLCEILEAEGFEASYCTRSTQALRLLAEQEVDLILLDIKMPGLSGIDLLRALKARDPAVPVVMITGYPSVDNIVQAMKLGASHVFAKPPNLDELVRVSRILLEGRRQKKLKVRHLLQTPIVTRDPKMLKILGAMEKFAATDAPVLLSGESGTGKELLAKAIHESSPRKDGPLVKVNCAAIPETLLESELFGHEKGAFTDAVQARKGKFELAHRGTIFFDEIGDMSPGSQAKILRVLQEQEFERVGGSEVLRADFRLIAASNRDLHELSSAGKFRDDLYYRLSVVAIDLPPLRERREDILLICDYYLSHFSELYSKRIAGLAREVQQLFLRHSWPGNIRELRNCVERAVIFCESSTIALEDLPAQYTQIPGVLPPADCQRAHDELDREVILEALLRSKGRKAKAAELLKIDRRTLYNRMKRLDLR